MSSLVINGDTSGSITLAAPAVAGSNTLTLPTLTGTVLTNKTAGTVLQVVQSTLSSGSVGTSSNSYSTTGLAASITPSASTNKVLISLNGGGQYLSGGAVRNLQVTVYRNATNLGGGTEVSLSRLYASIEIVAPHSICFLDSPSTTSSTTYTVYMKSVNSNQVFFYIGGDSGVVALTLMEIAA